MESTKVKVADRDGGTTSAMIDLTRVRLYAMGSFTSGEETLFDTLAEVLVAVGGVTCADIWAGDPKRPIRKGRAGAMVVGAGGDDIRVAVRSDDGEHVIGGVNVSVRPDADRAAVVPVVDAVAEHLKRMIRQWTSSSEGGGLALVDEDGRLLWANAELGELTGWSPSDVVGANVLAYIHPDDLVGAAESFERTSRFTGPKEPYDLRFRTAAGAWVSLEVVAENRLDDPEVLGIIFSFRDPDERTPADRLVSHEAKVLGSISSGKDRSTICDLIFEMVGASISAAGWSLFAPSDPSERTMHRVASTDSGSDPLGTDSIIPAPSGTVAGACWSRGQTVIAQTIDDERCIAATLRAHYGAARVAAVWAVPVTRSDGSVLAVLEGYFRAEGRPTGHQSRVLDLAVRLLAVALDRDSAAQQRFHDASHDALTGLPNRVGFTEMLDRRLASSRAGDTTVLFVDLDAFKQVNDSLGYVVGDELLRAVAARIENCCEAAGHPGVLARCGGDEFTVLVPDGAVARELAEAILQTFADVFAIGGHEIYVTATIGMAVHDGAHSSGGAGLLSKADAAMYAAKRRTPRRIVTYDNEILADVNSRLAVTTDLRRAVDRHEFVVHFQKIIEFATNRTVSAEALVRWQQDLTLHPPSRFLAIAEDTGLVIPIGRQVLHDAVERASTESDQTTYVNLSPHQLLHDDLMSTIEAALDDHGVSPDRLGFEITEHAVIPDPRAAIAVLERISRAGHPIAIDDFGTGYASLAYLRDLPVDVVKIDRSFTARVHDDARTRTIVAATIDLAHALGLTVVAEGIEQKRDADLMAALGCDRGQGWYFHVPEP